MAGKGPVAVATLAQHQVFAERMIADLSKSDAVIEALDGQTLHQCLLPWLRTGDTAKLTEPWVNYGAIAEMADSLGGVVIIAKDFQEHMAIQRTFNPLKDLGVPVAAGFGYIPHNHRPAIAPNMRGVTYPGMFDVARIWIGSLRCENPTYVEFGTLEGRTMSMAWHFLKEVPNLDFVAFDTFAGIASPLEEEAWLFPEGSFYANRATFEHNMAVCGVDPDRLQIVQGDICETAKPDAPEMVGIDLGQPAMVNIDVDVYAPSRQALELLTPHLVQGSLLVFDDYDAFGADPTVGERLALSEWVAAHDDIEVEPFRNYGTFGRAFLVHTPNGRGVRSISEQKAWAKPAPDQAGPGSG